MRPVCFLKKSGGSRGGAAPPRVQYSTALRVEFHDAGVETWWEAA